MSSRALSRAGAAVFAIGAVAICGTLGWWQWSRAHEQSVSVAPEPMAPIADVLAPATQAGGAVGRQVSVSGAWLDVPAILVSGRELEGEPVVLLVRALEVDAELTGTGQAATLPVIVGWRPADSPMPPDPGAAHVDVTGYLRPPEEATTASGIAGPEIPGTVWDDTVSPAALAQTWPAPMYSASLASFEGSESWQPLPPPPEEKQLNIRSLLYALEWWIFGGFAVFIAVRWMRDNGRTQPMLEEAQQ